MKRMNVLLLLVLAAAVGLFGCYLIWIHNNLDTIGPVITIEEGILEISVEDPEDALMQGVRALDDRDGDVTSRVLVESIYGINADNVTTVTYAAFDAAGNVTKTQRQVRYRDYQPPRFVLYGSLTFAHGSSFDLLEYVGASDVLEGDIRRRVHATLISDTRSIDEEGSHQVKLQVTSGLGDTQEIVVPVEVYDPEWYAARVTLSEYMLYLEKGDVFKPRDYLESFQLRGDPVDLSRTVPQEILVDIDNDVNTAVPGVYEVTYTLTQTLNMDTYSGIAKLIVIVE